MKHVSLFRKLKKPGLFDVDKPVDTDQIYQAYSKSKVWKCLEISHIDYKKPPKLTFPRTPIDREIKRRPISAVNVKDKSIRERPLSCRLFNVSVEIEPKKELLEIKNDPVTNRRRRLSQTVQKTKRASQIQIPKVKIKRKNRFM